MVAWSSRATLYNKCEICACALYSPSYFLSERVTDCNWIILYVRAKCDFNKDIYLMKAFEICKLSSEKKGSLVVGQK